MDSGHLVVQTFAIVPLDSGIVQICRRGRKVPHAEGRDDAVLIMGFRIGRDVSFDGGFGDYEFQFGIIHDVAQPGVVFEGEGKA